MKNNLVPFGINHTKQNKFVSFNFLFLKNDNRTDNED